MIQISIESKYNMIVVHEEKVKKSRLEWTAPGIEIYIKGAFKPSDYAVAANIAMNYALGIGIQPSWLRRVSK